MIGKDNVDSEVKFKVVLQDSVTISPETSEVILRGTILFSESCQEIKESSFIFCPRESFENEKNIVSTFFSQFQPI